ncbi:DUF7289 family protein [Haloarcula montana]|uniref:DUF7289 family protein n=1 Tax=Haloarcula montana TaxID=3111776 RepID=UPI003DA9DD4C
MTLEGSNAIDKRGVSTVVAAVLLIGITMVGIAVVLLAGSAVMEDLNTDSNEEISEETMLKVDSVFQQSDEEGQTFEISDEVDKDVSINRNATYSLTLNGDSNCMAGPRQMGTIRHDGKDTVTAYEAGGVWKMTEAGAVMSAPPDLNYDNGSLSVSFTNVTGDLTSSGTLKATSNVTQEVNEQRNISRELYGSGACSPTTVDNASLRISNSTFARAWADWARSNYDDKRVNVSVEGGMPAEPHDNVTITFQLGDVSDPEFRAKNVTVTPGPGSDYEVSAKIRNAGGLSATKEVSFVYNNGTVDTTKDLTLAGKASKTVTFTLDDSDIVSGSPPRPRNVTVAADDNSTTKVQFNSPSATPNVGFSAENISTGTTVGNTTDGHVWVNNTGGMTKTAAIGLNVTGQPNTTWSATVHPGENVSQDISDALPINREGKHQLNFTVGSDSMQVPFVVGPPGRFEINSLNYNTPTRGDTETFSATVENVGNQTMTGYVNATVKNEDTGTVVASTNSTETLANTDTATRSVTHTFSNTGTYSVTLTTPNQTQRSTFYVKAGNAAPNFVINRLEIDPSSVRVTNDVTIGVTVTNSGGTTDEQTLDLENEETNTDLEEWDVTLNPGQEKTKTFTTTVENNSVDFDMGQNTIEAETENGSLSQILEVRAEGSGVEEGEDSDGSEFLEFTKDARIEIVAGGSELEGNGTGYYGRYEIAAPTTVRTYVENETTTDISPLWTDEYGGNINHPHAEQRMYRETIDNPYVKEMNVTAGSKLSVWGTSYYCRDYRDDGYNHYRTFQGTEYELDAYTCSDWGGERIDITNTKSSSNVIILGNGDKPPALGQASAFQLGLDDMLDTVNASIDENGNLQLAEDQYIFMYELSERNALPENADQPNDPDYNDAVVSLKIVSTERENVQPATFNITDVDAPARVSSGSGDTSVDVTINNTGEKAGQASIHPAFDGSPQSPETTGVLDPGEETDITITLPTASYGPGTYNWDVEARGSDGVTDDSQAQQLRIGSAGGPYYQVTKMEGQAVAEINNGTNDIDDSNPVISTQIDNIGSRDGTNMDLTLVYENTDTGTSYSVTKTRTISAGTSTGLTFEITATPGREGNYSYYVTTPNTTSGNQSIELGQSDVEPANINIGTKDYTPGTQIVRRGRISRMNVGVENVGQVSDEREVRLRISKDDGTTVVDSSKTETVYTGATQPTQYGFDVSSLSTGNTYDYEIRVYNDTQSAESGENTTVRGDLFLQKVPDGVSTREDSPVNVDSEVINVTAP